MIGKRYKVKLKDKEEDTHPLDKKVCDIGACCYLTEKCNFRCSPSPPTIQEYVRKVQKLDRIIGRLIPKD